MNVLSLFSGIGGLDLAAEWAGMKTVAFCERDQFCRKVLAKHWPGVPCFDDVTTLKGSDINEPVDIIAGGFPCQPFSEAGRRLGAADDRHLWPEYFRLIQELRPAWVVGENVVGIIHLELDNVLADLESIGYTCRSFDIPACAVGAIHQRRRIFIVAHSGREHGEARRSQKQIQPAAERRKAAGDDKRCDWWLSEPSMGRVVNGVPRGLDCFRAIGNAVAPQQAYPIFKAIADLESGISPAFGRKN